MEGLSLESWGSSAPSTQVFNQCSMNVDENSMTDSTVYYNLPALAPGQRQSRRFLKQSSENSTTAHSESSNSLHLAEQLSNPTACGGTIFNKKSSLPRKLAAPTSCSIPIPIKRTSLGRVLLRKGNKDREKPAVASQTGSLPRKLKKSQGMNHDYQEINDSNTFPSDEQHSTVESKDDNGFSKNLTKASKKKSNSTTGIFSSWLKKKSKEDSACLPTNFTENTNSVDNDTVKKDDVFNDICITESLTTVSKFCSSGAVREPSETTSNVLVDGRSESEVFSPRAVSGVSWRFDDASGLEIAAGVAADADCRAENPPSQKVNELHLVPNVSATNMPESKIASNFECNVTHSLDSDYTVVPLRKLEGPNGMPRVSEGGEICFLVGVPLSVSPETFHNNVVPDAGLDVQKRASVDIYSSHADMHLTMMCCPSDADASFSCDLSIEVPSLTKARDGVAEPVLDESVRTAPESRSSSHVTECLPIVNGISCVSPQSDDAPTSLQSEIIQESVHLNTLSSGMAVHNMNYHLLSNDDLQIIKSEVNSVTKGPPNISYPVHHWNHILNAAVEKCSTSRSSKDVCFGDHQPTANLADQVASLQLPPRGESSLTYQQEITMCSDHGDALCKDCADVNEIFINNDNCEPHDVGTRLKGDIEIETVYKSSDNLSGGDSDALANISKELGGCRQLPNLLSLCRPTDCTDGCSDIVANMKETIACVESIDECERYIASNRNGVGLSDTLLIPSTLTAEASDLGNHSVKGDPDKMKLDGASSDLVEDENSGDGVTTLEEIYSTSCYTTRMSCIKSRGDSASPGNPFSDHLENTPVSSRGFSNDLYLHLQSESPSQTPTLQRRGVVSRVPQSISIYETRRELVQEDSKGFHSRRLGMSVGAAQDAPKPEDLDPGRFDPTAIDDLLASAHDPASELSPGDRKVLLDIQADVEDWRRKNEWLLRRKRMKNWRKIGGASADAVVIHAGDGALWAAFLQQLLQHMLGGGGAPPRVECRNIEQVLGPTVPPILADRLHSARLQLVVVSPGFLRHTDDPQLEFGRVMVPRRALALLLAVTTDDVTERHLGALFSFKEWPLLGAQSPATPWLCAAVLRRGVSTICRSSTYRPFLQQPARGAFRICPPKITELQRHVHLLVEDVEEDSPPPCSGAPAPDGGSDGAPPLVRLDDVCPDEVVLEVASEVTGACTRITDWKCRNPYCISFKMPEWFLRESCLVEVRLTVSGRPLGGGKIKCESKLETLAGLLSTLGNGADVMSQSLHLSPVPWALDTHLAACVRDGLPLSLAHEPSLLPLRAAAPAPAAAESSFDRTHSLIAASRPPSESLFPTWLHFAAHHGLSELAGALLAVPGWRDSVRLANSAGHTPDKLAHLSGHDDLAERLEYLALVTAEESLEGFDSPPNLSELSSRLHASPHDSPFTDGLARTASTGSSRSAVSAFSSFNSHRSVGGPADPSSVRSGPGRCVAGPADHLGERAGPVLPGAVDATAASQPVLPGAVDAAAASQPSLIRGIRGYQSIPRLAGGDREGLGNRGRENVGVEDGSEDSDCCSEETVRVGTDYDVVAAPRPVPLRYLSKANVQSIMMGGAFGMPTTVFARPSASHSINCTNRASIQPTTRSNPTAANHPPEYANDAFAYNNSIRDSVPPLPPKTRFQVTPTASATDDETRRPRKIPTTRSPGDSLPPTPQPARLDTDALINYYTNGATSTVLSDTIPFGREPGIRTRDLDSPHSSGSNASAGNERSAISDGDVVWTGGRGTPLPAGDSPDNSYLDMSRSDFSVLNRSASMLHRALSFTDSSYLQTPEQLRLNAHLNSTSHYAAPVNRHFSPGFLEVTNTDSSSLALSLNLVSETLTRSVTLPEGLSSPSPHGPPLTIRCNSDHRSDSTHSAGPALGAPNSPAQMNAAAITASQALHGGSSAVPALERNGFNHVSDSIIITTSDATATNSSREGDRSALTSVASGSDSSISSRAAPSTGSEGPGMAARLRGFFKVRSRGRASPGLQESGSSAGDPSYANNYYVDDPTARAGGKEGTGRVPANGALQEASIPSPSDPASVSFRTPSAEDSPHDWEPHRVPFCPLILSSTSSSLPRSAHHHPAGSSIPSGPVLRPGLSSSPSSGPSHLSSTTSSPYMVSTFPRAHFSNTFLRAQAATSPPHSLSSSVLKSSSSACNLAAPSGLSDVSASPEFLRAGSEPRPPQPYPRSDPVPCTNGEESRLPPLSVSDPTASYENTAPLMLPRMVACDDGYLDLNAM